MTPSEYLKIQAALLIAVDELRRLPLDDFLARAQELEAGDPLRDAEGRLVVTRPGSLAAIARGAQIMVAHGPHAVRRPAGHQEESLVSTGRDKLPDGADAGGSRDSMGRRKPRQLALCLDADEVPPADRSFFSRRISPYDQANRDCALIILGDRVRYGSEESLAVRWAREIVARHG